MIKKIIALLFITSLAFAGIYKYSNTSRYVNKEITAAGKLELVAATTGQSIVIKSYIASCTAAVNMYMYQGATATNKVSPYYQLAAKDVVVRDFKDTGYLDAGNALNLWISADPNEGWIEVVYDVVNITE